MKIVLKINEDSGVFFCLKTLTELDAAELDAAVGPKNTDKALYKNMPLFAIAQGDRCYRLAAPKK